MMDGAPVSFIMSIAGTGRQSAAEARRALDDCRRSMVVDRIRTSFLSDSIEGGLEPIPHRPYLGLGYLTTGFRYRGNRFPSPPLGWRWLKLEDRNAAILLPLWLWWPAYAARYIFMGQR